MPAAATRRGAPPSARAPRRGRALLVVVLAACAAVTGCVAIPTDGPIGRGDVPLAEPAAAVPIGNDPVVDATPQQIVNDFLTASTAGFRDEFTVARRYLTRSASAEWDPRARTLVYVAGAGPSIEVAEERGPGFVRVTVPVAAYVDRSGRYTEGVPGSRDEELVFELRQDSRDQWRIAALDDVVLLSEPNFGPAYSRTPVYFATADQEHLVPDLRWFPADKVATYAVDALLEGPSPWLRDAVDTGVPEGASRSTAAVAFSPDSEATVDLAAETNRAETDRQLLQAQLEATIPDQNGVRVTVGGLPWETGPTPVLERDVAPVDGPFLLVGDRLAVVQGGQVVPLPDVAPLTGLDARSPALSPDTATRVVLSGTSQLLLLPPAAAPPVPLVVGTDLLPPSVDRHGWVWTGERASTGRLVGVRADGTDVEVNAPWLEGRVVRSLRVARDGARIAVVSALPTGADVTVHVAGVVRNESGDPLRITEGLPIGAVLDEASQVAWVDEVTVAVLGRSADLSVDTLHLVTVGGPTRALTYLDATVGIASGKSDRSLYLVDADGTLIARQGSGWKEVPAPTPVRDPTFPG